MSSVEHKLPDYLAPGLRAVICGTAAASRSVSRSHYYAGVGNLFWTYLYDARLTTEALSPSTDYRILEFGLGLTDLAKSIAASSDRQLAAHYDIDAFVAKVRQYEPTWVAFHGKEAARQVRRKLGLGRAVDLGEQTWDVANARVFVLPSASGSNRDRTRLEGKADRLDWFSEFASLLRQHVAPRR
jgi:TDG/mug DNA glycosylase family protein